MRRVCNNFGTTCDNIGFPDELKYYCITFMLQYRLNSIFRNVNIDDVLSQLGLWVFIKGNRTNNKSAPLYYSRHDTLIQFRFNIETSSAMLPQK